MYPASLNQPRLLRHIAQRVGLGALLTFGLWLIGAIAGTILLTDYAGRAAPRTQLPANWPVDSLLPTERSQHHLIMFIHPKCPCTRASLHELERLLAKSQRSLAATVVVVQPPDTSESWVATDLVQVARAIPGVRVVVDHDGEEARRFKALTSGEMALYDPTGQLLFHGGLTPARGHEGDSSGKLAVLRLLDQRTAAACSPAFGCPLLNTGVAVRAN